MSDIPLRIEKLLWRGRGLARLENGQIVMVEPGVLPGEEIRARLCKSTRDYVVAEALEILSPSALRGRHPCPHATACGGSRFGMVRPEDGLLLKHAMLQDALSRALGRGHNALLPTVATMPSPMGWRYRWRGQIHVREGLPHAMAQNSNALVPLTDCHLLAYPLAKALPRLAATLPDGRFTVAASPDTLEARSENESSLLQFSLPRFDLTLHLPPHTFFQANWGLNQELVRFVTEAAAPYARIADLYAGAGNFALPLARQNKTVLALEGSPDATQTGQNNARRLGLRGARFGCANLAKPSAWNEVRSFRPECVILDPPRTGAKGIGPLLLGLPETRRLIWVSCDVVNTIRDARPLLEAGWSMTAVTLFDMFPGTWHMEVLFVLDRPRPKRPGAHTNRHV